MAPAERGPTENPTCNVRGRVIDPALPNIGSQRTTWTVGVAVPTGADQVFGGGGICRDALRASTAPTERGPTENPNPTARPWPPRSGALQKIQTLRRVHGPDGAGPYRKSKPYGASMAPAERGPTEYPTCNVRGPVARQGHRGCLGVYSLPMSQHGPLRITDPTKQ
jgi:hypothetical protein